MDTTNRIIEFPATQPQSLVWVAVILVAAVAFAVFLDIMRRRRTRNKRILTEWRHMQNILDEKELSEKECEVVESLVERYALDHPVDMVTSKTRFDQVVGAEMAALADEDEQKVWLSMGSTLRGIREQLGLDFVPIGREIHSTRDLCREQSVWYSPERFTVPRWTKASVNYLDEACFHLTPQGPVTPDGSVDEGENVRCRMWREEDGRYVFTTVALGRAPETNDVVFYHSEHLNRMQSRAFFRVHCEQSCMLGVVSAPPDGAADDLGQRRIQTRIRGRITNLSAGGCALVISQAIPRQVFLRIRLDLPGSAAFEVHARVVMCSPLSSGRHLVRSAFVDLDEEHRDAIAKYILSRQTTPGQTNGQPRS